MRTPPMPTVISFLGPAMNHSLAFDEGYSLGKHHGWWRGFTAGGLLTAFVVELLHFVWLAWAAS